MGIQTLSTLGKQNMWECTLWVLKFMGISIFVLSKMWVFKYIGTKTGMFFEIHG